MFKDLQIDLIFWMKEMKLMFNLLKIVIMVILL